MLGAALYWGGSWYVLETARSAASKPFDLSGDAGSVPSVGAVFLFSFLAFANAVWGLVLIVAGFIDYAKAQESKESSAPS